MHELVVRDAKVLENGKWRITDIGVDQGKFTSFEPDSGHATLDAKERIVLPGGLDLHVHFNEPGRTHWEGFATGSLSAAAGGNTFLVEMPLNSIPSTVSVESLRLKRNAIGQQSRVDYALWGGLVPGNENELQALAQAGVAGFKAFMSPSGTDDFANSDTETLRRGMKEIAKTGKVLALHAEDPAVLEAANASLPSKISALDWEKSRPVAAEVSAIKIAIELAAETGCRIHIVHVSSPDALQVIVEAKALGLPITCETCPHYLLIAINEADAIGPLSKCAPPLRDPKTVRNLWKSLRNGEIDTIGSDHSPCPPEMKIGKSFYDAWGGISGLQHGLPLLWQEALNDPELFQILIDLSCKSPSGLIGLDSKGSLSIGKDADFALVEELERATPISTADLHYRHPQSAYCDKLLRLQVSETWLRGNCVYRQGRAVGKPQGRHITF
ncbi:allantoinase [Verrucomicrobiia bacterium DG1235]|nr:allantoinase [Verrucomicrobiae bacterium DG1235]